MSRYILILFLLPWVLAKAQKEIIILEISKSNVKINEAFSVKVKSTMEGDISIQFPTEFHTGYSVMNGMEQAYDRESGEIKTIHYYNQEGFFTKPGVFTIGPAIIKRGKSVMRSNKVTVDVSQNNTTIPDKQTLDLNTNQPAFGKLISNKKSVYIGESFMMQAKVYSKFPPMSVEDYASYLHEGNLAHHSLDKNTFLSAKQENIGGVNWYSFEHDRNLIFPSHSGSVKINPFKLVLRQGFDEVAVISDNCSIEVKPLPTGAPSSFIGFVGNLKAEAKSTGKCNTRGDILKYELVFTGKGNLHHIEAPTLNLPKGIELYESPKLTEDYIFTENGAEGKVIVNYTLVATDSSNNSIANQTVSYFDLSQNKYVTLDILTTNTNSASFNATDPLTPQEGTKIMHRKKNASQVNNLFSLISPVVLWSAAGFVTLGAIGMGVFFMRKKRNTLSPSSPLTQNSPVQLSWEELHERLDLSLKAGEITQLEQIILDSVALKLQFTQHQSNVLNDFKDKYPLLQPEVLTLLHTIKEVRYGMNLLQETPISLIERTRIMLKTIEQY